MLPTRFREVVVIAILTCMLLSNSVLVEAKEECEQSLIRAPPSEFVENFKHFVQRRFFGQDHAVDVTISALRRFKPKDLLLLHFVGASGTGKTNLASIVQRSFFKLDQCIKFDGFNRVLNGFLDSIPCVRKHQNFDLPTINQECGVGYVDFMSAADKNVSTRVLLQAAMERAFTTQRIVADAPVILFFDNFNHCKDSCERLMTEIASTKRYHSASNRIYTLSNTVMLVTSDLTQDGLRLWPGDDANVAMRKVLQVSKNAWGDESLWNDHAFVAPFVPYTDQELIKILELTLTQVMDDLQLRIDEAMQDERERLGYKVFGGVRWVGRFRFPEGEKLRLIEKLHVEVARQNCRAFEKIRSKLVASTRRPESVETLLLKTQPYIDRRNQGGFMKKVIGFVQTNPEADDVQYTQNIVFKVVDDDRIVISEVEDVDKLVSRADEI